MANQRISGSAYERLGLKLVSTWVPAGVNSGRTSNSYQCKVPENNYLTLSRCHLQQNYRYYTPSFEKKQVKYPTREG